MTSAALAIVPVDVDDRSAPLGCAALRRLRGRPLVAWAVDALTSSGVVPLTLVAVPPALQRAVAEVLPGRTADVEVLPVQANGPGLRVRAALASPEGRGAAPREQDVVVVHDPLHPLSSAAVVRDVVDALVRTAGCAASAPARPVTDTLKWIDEDEVVRETVDREGYRMIYSPQAYRRAALAHALATAPERALRAPGGDVLPRLVQIRGGAVTLVPLRGESLRIAAEDDLVLVEALLHAHARLD